jgi:hypothetical protein
VITDILKILCLASFVTSTANFFQFCFLFSSRRRQYVKDSHSLDNEAADNLNFLVINIKTRYFEFYTIHAKVSLKIILAIWSNRHKSGHIQSGNWYILQCNCKFLNYVIDFYVWFAYMNDLSDFHVVVVGSLKKI